MRVTLSELTSIDFKRDPYPRLRQLREQGTLADIRLPVIGDLKFVTRHESVEEVLRDRQRFVMEPSHAGVSPWKDFRSYLPRPLRVLTNSMLLRDEPDHRRLRSLAEQAFRRNQVEAMRSRITGLTNLRIDAFAGDSKLELVEQYARVIPLDVICELLGLPMEDRTKFSLWVGRLTNASFPVGVMAAIPGIMQLTRYLRQRFELERTHPTGGLISELVAAEDEGSKLSSDELLTMVFLLLFAGLETTTHLISLSLWTLQQHDNLKSQWLARPELRSSAVDELLRYLSPIQMTKPRYVAKDTTLGEAVLRRGERVLGLLAAANTDPKAFDDPESIVFDRRPNVHVGFGGGIHFCLGAQLARLETEIAITQIFERFPDFRILDNDDSIAWTRRLGVRSMLRLNACL